MKIIFAISFILIFISCSSNQMSSYDEVRKQYGKYVFSHRINNLKKSYHSLIRNDDFKKNGITNTNFSLAIPILIDSKEYDLLITLLNKSKVLTEYHKFFYINLTKALKFRCKDSVKSNYYIDENSTLIKKYISLNQADSNLYIDYYINKLYISSLESVLTEIDSLRDKKFSDEFYQYTLKDAIKEYNNQIVRCK